MRVDRRSFLVVAAIVATCATGAGAQQASPEPPPEFDVGVSVGPYQRGPVQLLGRANPDTIYCSLIVRDAGGHNPYFEPVQLALDPGSSQHVSREASGFTFRFTAKVPDPARGVGTELVISRGSRVVARYQNHTQFPSPP